MSKYPAVAAGQRITASLLSSMLPDVVVKVADEGPLASTTTLQNDDELFLSTEASAKYDLDVQIFAITANTDIAGDIKLGFTFPAGATLHFTGAGPHNSDLTSGSSSNGNGEWVARMSATSGTTNIPYGMSGIAIGVRISGTLITSTTAGTLQLQWAQNTSDPDGLTVLAGSRMTLRRVA